MTAEGGARGLVRSRLDPEERFGLRLTLLAVAVVIVAVPVATLTFQVEGGGSLTRLDGRLADRLNAWVHRRSNVLAGLEAVSVLGRFAVLAPVAAATALVAWRRGRRRLAAFVLVAPATGGLVNTLVKLAVDRPRPQVDHPVSSAYGNSFPSGHAMGATVTWGVVVFAVLVLWPELGRTTRSALPVAGVLLVAAIGASRVLLGVHFLTDVVAGHLLGIAWLAGAVAAARAWQDESGHGTRPTGRSDPLDP